MHRGILAGIIAKEINVIRTKTIKQTKVKEKETNTSFKEKKSVPI
jgi:hypothetical protein